MLIRSADVAEVIDLAEEASPTPAAAPAHLLQEHVLPALVARGLVSPAAQIEWAEEGTPQHPPAAPPAGDRTPPPLVRATGRRDSSGRAMARTRATSAGTRVQVTIDKVEIVTPPAPPPLPVESEPGRPQVDHGDYRARRRQGWR